MRVSVALLSVILGTACNGTGSSGTADGGHTPPPVDAETGSPADAAGATAVDAGADAADVAIQRAIVVSATLDGQAEPDLYWMSEDGSRVVRLTSTPGGELFPKWSPDRTRVAFVRDAQLFLLDLAGGGERLIAAHAGRWRPGYERSGAAWSPDGSRLAYTYPRDPYNVGENGLDESYNTTLHFVNADGTNDVAYSEPTPPGPEGSHPPGIGSLGDVAWSSTNQIAFVVDQHCPDCAGGRYYAVSNPDGSAFDYIAPYQDNPLYPYKDLDWSLNATRWMFAVQVAGPEGWLYEIATRSVATNDAAVLTSTGASYPRYSPDGGQVAFLRADGIYVMNVDGTNQHRLLSATSVGSIDW